MHTVSSPEIRDKKAVIQLTDLKLKMADTCRKASTSSPGSSLVWRVTRDEDPGEIGNNSKPDWSTFNIAFSTSGL